MLWSSPQRGGPAQRSALRSIQLSTPTFRHLRPLWVALVLTGLCACTSTDGGPPPLCVDDASCADEQDCTLDTCDPAVGCVHEPQDVACDDGVVCTLDLCGGEQGCVSTPRDEACDDGVACTLDGCDEDLGCVFTPQHAPCEDGDVCTIEGCDPVLGCTSSPEGLNCDDGIDCTVDGCDPLSGCTATPDDGACVPDVGCLTASCQAGTGCVSVLDHAQCDDGDACTGDLCDEEGGCAHTPLSSGACDDGDPCTTDDGCALGLCRGSLLEGCFYLEDPDVPSCDPGVLSPGRKLQAMDGLNQIRALSGLAPVGYQWNGDVETQASSLVMVANSSIGHEPPPSSLCWTQAAADGAITSNLHLSWQWEPDHQVPWTSLVAFLIDDGVPSLGHRRWLLDPFLAHVSYGAVHGAAQIPGAAYPYAFASNLQVIHGEHADISDTDLEWVAYPVGEYPADLFNTDWYLSFSWLIDKVERYPNSQVDFTDLVVTVTDPNETPLPVLDLEANTDWFGLPNNVQWRVDGLTEGVEYTVTVEGAATGDTPLSTTYTFILL